MQIVPNYPAPHAHWNHLFQSTFSFVDQALFSFFFKGSSMAHPCTKNEPCPITMALKLFKDTDFIEMEIKNLKFSI